MNKTKRVGLSTIAAFAMAACTFATLGMANGISANAEAVEPTPAAEGWYIVGNGAGSLSESSWTEYVPEFKLQGAAGRVGTFTYEGLTLYEGDAFKVLYADGEWAYPNDSGWTEDVTGQFSNLATNIDGYFVNGGLGNIQATEAGEGTIILRSPCPIRVSLWLMRERVRLCRLYRKRCTLLVLCRTMKIVTGQARSTLQPAALQWKLMKKRVNGLLNLTL